jgi:hypothetical protein
MCGGWRTHRVQTRRESLNVSDGGQGMGIGGAADVFLLHSEQGEVGKAACVFLLLPSARGIASLSRD